jgi:ribonuclease III
VLARIIDFIILKVPRKSRFHDQILKLAGLVPRNIELYKCALTHKSLAKANCGPNTITHNNERLEYLGDAILSAVIADYLFSAYPGRNEGLLTRMRSRMVSRQTLNYIATKIGLDNMVMLHNKAIPTKKHIFGNALEAFIGAIYIDKGYISAKKFITEKILWNYPGINKLEYEDSDFKSQIIEWGQKNKQEISFESHEIAVKDNPVPVFLATIRIMNMLAGEGLGTTKKEAQQHAAGQALKNLPS